VNKQKRDEFKYKIATEAANRLYMHATGHSKQSCCVNKADR